MKQVMRIFRPFVVSPPGLHGGSTRARRLPPADRPSPVRAEALRELATGRQEKKFFATRPPARRTVRTMPLSVSVEAGTPCLVKDSRNVVTTIGPVMR
jgi:hypothetical protein